MQPTTSDRICGATGGYAANDAACYRGVMSASDGNNNFDAKGWLAQATTEIRDGFARNRRVISFEEYLALFAADPARQLRSAGQYLRDVFDHFGTETVRTPRGPMTRWRLFDCPWDGGKDALRDRRRCRRGLPPGVELRARGAHQPPHPAARAERQRQVDLRRLPAARDRALLDARRGRALPLQLDLPVAEAGQGGHRLRRRRSSDRRRARPSPTWTTSWSTPRSSDELRDHPLLLLAAPKRRDADRRARSRRSTGPGSAADYILLRRPRRTRTGRSSRRCSSRTTATTSRCCATSRSSASTCRAATGRRRSPSSRSWRSTRGRASSPWIARWARCRRRCSR